MVHLGSSCISSCEIRHPEVAILGIGKIDKKPVVINDEIVIRHMMPITKYSL